MTTTVKLVENYLRTDPAVQVALDRGFLNVRKTARWMIETQEWETTEEAVVSALRRYEPAEGVDIESVCHLLGLSEVTFETGYTLISLPAASEFSCRIPAIMDAVDPRANLTVFPERKRIKFFVDTYQVETVLDEVPDKRECEVSPDLARLEVLFPETGKAASTALSVIVNTLCHQDYSAVGLYGTLRTFSLFVPEGEMADVFDLIQDLIDRTSSSYS